jgi:hypothetical protein
MMIFTKQDHHVGTVMIALVHVITVGNAPLDIYTLNLMPNDLNI